MKQSNDTYRRLAQAIANRQAHEAKEVLGEIRGSVITIRSFMDLMQWSTAIEDENSKYVFKYDFEPNLQALFNRLENE